MVASNPDSHDSDASQNLCSEPQETSPGADSAEHLPDAQMGAAELESPDNRSYQVSSASSDSTGNSVGNPDCESPTLLEDGCSDTEGEVRGSTTDVELVENRGLVQNGGPLTESGDDSADAFRGRPGPGLPEAISWTLGVIIVHVIAVVGLMIVFGIVYTARFGPEAATRMLQDSNGPHTTILLFGEMGLFVLATIIASYYRLGPGRFVKRLGSAPLAPLHLLCILFLLVPLSLVSGEIYQIVDREVWQPLVDANPQLQQIDQYNTVEAIGEISGRTGFGLLILVLAVSPAIGEELVFRGVIGRGLVARWGPVAGVLLTSLLFAVVHLHPVHVAGVFLLGVTMHYLHLVTRSFLAPVLFHFLNNTWASFWSKFSGPEVGGVAPDSPTPLLGLGISIALITAVIVVLWQSRVIYVGRDGERWSPGYCSVETPSDSAIQRTRLNASLRAVLVMGLFAIVFLGLYVTDLNAQ